MNSIFELSNILNNLKREDEKSYELFSQIYSFYSEVGKLNILQSMRPLFIRYFGGK